MTVRHATDALVAEGLVERRHGSGTFVLPRTPLRFLGLTSFTQDMLERGLVPASRLLAFGVTAADAGPRVAAARRRRRARCRLHPAAARQRRADGGRVGLDPGRPSCPGIAPDDLGGSLYELLARATASSTGAASVTIEPVLPDAETRAHLAIPDDQACLRLRMIDSDARGRVVMAADCTIAGTATS